MHDKVIKKFNDNGTSRSYRGHSVICKLPQDSLLASTLRAIRSELHSHELYEKLFKDEALLPESSWHMTVFICVRDLERGEDVMPGGDYAAAIKARNGLVGPYEEWLEYSKEQVRHVVLDGGNQLPYQLEVKKQAPRIDYSIGVRLEATEDAKGKLQSVRELVAKQTGISSPKNYVFHITLAYLLKDPTEEEADALKEILERHLENAPTFVEFPAVGLYSFENMQGFNEEVPIASV